VFLHLLLHHLPLLPLRLLLFLRLLFLSKPNQ
jgi:hypothetical protein